ncbi:MAG: site-2 protease family protein [Erysipelotrichaceae bacterium]|nr:site-2 protease family protein [Erysipelotrichaceae bacterium]
MSILYTLLILSVIIMVHEIGHLASAKLFNVYCQEFSLGMGPKIWGFKRKETSYNLRLFPFGGFVNMAGEAMIDVEVPHERTLLGIKKYQRIIIMLSGIFMNFILAFVLFVGINWNLGYIYQSPKAVIAGVVENSPAEVAGLQLDDKILKMTFVDGSSIIPKNFDDVITYTQLYHNEITFTLLRGSTELTISVTPVYDEENQRYFLGVMLPPSEKVTINLFEGIGYAFNTMIGTIYGMFLLIGKLLTGVGLQSVSGPLGIIEVTQTQASYGLLNMIYLTAILSLNVGVFNLLPLPILDGGRVFLILIEMIIKKPINKKFELALMYGSALVMILLMVLATWQDLGKLL